MKIPTMKITAYRDVCIGAGMCVMNAPEVFDQSDQHGFAGVARPRVAVDERNLGGQVERVAHLLQRVLRTAEVVARHDERRAVVFEPVDGVPGVGQPAGDIGPDDQASPRVLPSRPRMNLADGGSVAAKPVPMMIASTSRSCPSSVNTPVGRISWMPSVTTSTFGRVSAGKYSLESRIRLQPMV